MRVKRRSNDRAKRGYPFRRQRRRRDGHHCATPSSSFPFAVCFRQVFAQPATTMMGMAQKCAPAPADSARCRIDRSSRLMFRLSLLLEIYAASALRREFSRARLTLIGRRDNLLFPIFGSSSLVKKQRGSWAGSVDAKQKKMAERVPTFAAAEEEEGGTCTDKRGLP